MDVNVHPSKLEVRFSKEAELTALIEAEVKRLFGRQVLIPQGISHLQPKGAYVQEQLELTRTVEPAKDSRRPRRELEAEFFKDHKINGDREAAVMQLLPQ